MWNDTDTPLAYFITFRTYGTWLHGERWSVNRFHNQFDTPQLPPNKKWSEINRSRMKGEPVRLDTRKRSIVERAICETCGIRNWDLFAINVRTNHVHVVVAAVAASSNVLNALKANATREMRADGCWNEDRSPWADKGSRRNVWNEEHIDSAIRYVLEGQGGDLPKLD